jgi:membrane fusion protein, copper/silver efflux system
MKPIHQIIIVVLALALGLGGGYLLFGGGNDPATHDHSTATKSADSTVETTYTCSMHPQIRQPEPGLCPICEMDLIPVGSNESSDPLVFTMTKEAAALANIQTTELGSQSGQRVEVSVSGRIAADERRLAAQTTHVGGRIENLYVSFTGEQVRAGQRLATVYSPELITAQQELIQAIEFRGAESDLAKAARKKLAYWKLPEDFIQEVINTREVQETIDVLADQGGTVADRMIAVGDYVQRGDVLFNLVDLSRLWILIDVYEADLAKVSVGDQIRFTTTAIPERIFDARIQFIDPLIDPRTRTATARAEISNRSGKLKPDMLVKGTIIGSSTTTADQVVVPASAVLWTGKRSVIYLVEPGSSVPSFRFREIVLGERVGNGYLVKSGLRGGEEVVTNGAFVIDAAAQLNNQASMMNRDVVLEGSEDKASVPDYRGEVDAGFQRGFRQMTESYIALKDAFVATDPTAAIEAATKLEQRLEQIDADLLTGDVYSFWQQHKRALDSHLHELATSEAVAAQRQQFEFISALMIDLVRAFGAEDTLYVQHCPMAFNNKGADWLAYEDQILNPYFGDEMLRCGVVQDSIQ